MTETSKKTASIKSLGNVVIPDETFVHDVVISDRYQTYSSELLRLALLGIAGIGFLIVNVILKDESKNILDDRYFIAFLSLSLFFLGLSAAGGLLHRWMSTNSLAKHLMIIRLEERSNEKDKKIIGESKNSRNRQFKNSGQALFFTGLFLWLGAVCLALSFIFGIFYH